MAWTALLIGCLVLAQSAPQETEAEMIARHAREVAAALQTSRVDAGDGFEDITPKIVALESLFERHLAEAVEAASSPRTVALDAVRYANAAMPRLSGRIIRVGPKRQFDTLDAALGAATAGDLLILGPGQYARTDRSVRKISDLAIVGQGIDVTTLTTGSLDLSRVLIEGVTIDCQNDPLADVRGGSAALRHCVVRNYNSGVGGSNGIFLSNGALLLEAVEFNGRDGRASSGSNFGNALDLRGDWFCLARGCRFIDNEEINRATGHLVMDACVSMSTSDRADGVIPYSRGSVQERDCSVLVRRGASSTFVHLSDDPDVVRAASQPAGHGGSLEAFIERLGLRRSAPYWIGLLRHADPEIRGVAAPRVRHLIGREVDIDTTSTDALADAGARLAIEVECARLLDWWDANRDTLIWDAEAGSYRRAP